MRWFVEISSIGGSPEPPVKLCVEAPQWQPALQKARALRGDEGPLSNFSIELLDEGYRAVDPATRQRYFVRKAPDDAPITDNKGATPAPGAVAAATPAPAPVAAATPAPAPVAAATPAPAPVAAAPVAKPEPPAEDKPVQTPAPAAAAPKKAMAQTMAFGSSGTAAVRTPDRPSAPAAMPPKKTTSIGMPAVTVPPAPSTAPVRKPTTPGMAAVSIPLLPQHKVHSSREENATASSPLTYREFVYVVAEGTTEDAAKELLLDRLELVTKGLADVQGKLVHMAVFDHAYQGKPQRKPLATLVWRDWRGEPVVVFPTRREQTVKEPPAPIKEAPAAVKEAPAPLKEAPVSARETPAPARPASTPPPAVSRSVTPPPARIATPAPKPVAPTAPRAPSVTPIPPRASTPAPAAARPSVPAPKASVPPPKAKSADEIMADLSGAMTDLHFLRDAMEAVDFVLKLVNDKFPCDVVLIWFHDAEKRELVLVRQSGGTTDQLLMRMADKTGLAHAATRSQRALVIPDAARDPRANEARWKTLGIEPKSMVIAPAMNSGKPYGLVEILNPKAGGRFGSLENNAMTYIGQQLGEFLANNGVILDADKVTAGAKRIG